MNDRIAAFIEAFPLIDSFASGRELLLWHGILTGCPYSARVMFCRERGLDIDAEYTIMQFLELAAECGFGRRVIKELREAYIAGGVSRERNDD